MPTPASSRADTPEPPEGRPTAVLFDVGNVIVRWDPRNLYAKLIDDPVALDHFLAEVCPMSWHAQTDRGRPFADNIAERSALYPDHAALIKAWWDRWPEMCTGPIAETVAVMDALHARGVAMHGLTNMSTEAWPGIQALSPAFRYLRTVVVSGEDKVIKPDPAIFRLVLERTGLDAADLLFIDDSAANIAAADRLGFHTHHFTDPAALRPQLVGLGLL